MRTILRLCLVVALVAAVGVVAVPTAQAQSGVLGKAAITDFEKKQNRKIRKAKRKARRAHARIEALKDWNFDQDSRIGTQREDFIALKSVVDTAVPLVTQALTDLQGGLLAIQAVLEDDVGPALEAIDAALNDETTGLVGLNLARPQFGVFDGTGNFLGGTGTVASGPDDDAVRVGAGTYVVDFNNDVSERVYTVTVAPTGGAGLTVAAVNCLAAAADPTIDGACDAAAGGDPADPHPDQVFVLLQNSTNAAPTDGTFTITALSG